MTLNFKTLTAAAALAVGLPAGAQAATMQYQALLTELNDSGVSGVVDFFVDMTAQTLTVEADISGLTPGDLHLNHIHGRFNEDGSPRDSVLPTESLDADGDGFVEVLEALPNYGDILLSLEDLSDGVHTGPFADDDGNLEYSLVFDLNDDSLFFSPVSGADYTSDDLFPLELREYVIHGGFVGAGVNDSVPGGGFVATLPVAAAEIAPVPVPAAGLLLMSALAGAGLMARRRAS